MKLVILISMFLLSAVLVSSLDIKETVSVIQVPSYQDTIVVPRMQYNLPTLSVAQFFVHSLTLRMLNESLMNKTIFHNISFQVNHSLVNLSFDSPLSRSDNNTWPTVSAVRPGSNTSTVIQTPINITNTTTEVIQTPENITINCNEARIVNQEYEPITESYKRLDSINGITKRVIGYTTQNRPIYVYELGSGPKFVFDGRLHGIEDCGTQNGIEFMKWASTQDLGVHLMFIPGINLDNKIGRINSNGVDLNRNFPEGWIQTPNDGYAYSGPNPASEDETKVMIKFFKEEKPVVYMNVHCGQTLMRYKENSKLASEITTSIRNLNLATYNKYSLRMIGTSTHGYIISEAQNYANVSILLESDGWARLPSSKECYTRDEWKSQQAIYKGIVEAIR